MIERSSSGKKYHVGRRKEIPPRWEKSIGGDNPDEEFRYHTGLEIIEPDVRE